MLSLFNKRFGVILKGGFLPPFTLISILYCMERGNFNVWRGVQKPLEFKGLKGRYIQWAGGILEGSFVLLMVIKFFFGWVIAVPIVLIGAGVSWLNMMSKAKKGTFTKNAIQGTVVINPKKKKL